jgi:hypothetical protein
VSELAKALCAVMSRVRYVPETGKNQFHRYSYASDEDLLTVLQPAMADAGLAMVPTRVESTTVEHSADQKGKAQWRTEVLVTYALMHASGETVTIQAPGCGIDGEDKGVYKAMTGARQRPQPAQRRDTPPPSPTPTSGAAEPVSGGGQRWTAEQGRAFFGSLARLVPPIPREEYDSLAAWCAATRGKRPSEMTAGERSELVVDLTTGEARVAYGEWAARQSAGEAA